MARARRYAGRVLLVKADEDREMFAVIDALRELPASITSMAERDSCPEGPSNPRPCGRDRLFPALT
jgi:hypothetical protein